MSSLDKRFARVAGQILSDRNTTQILTSKKVLASFLETEFAGFEFLEKPKKIAKTILKTFKKEPEKFPDRAALETFLRSKYRYDQHLRVGNEQTTVSEDPEE